MRQFLPIFLFLPGLSAAAAESPIEFNQDIRPILTSHCTACHGGVKAAGGVSFIYREKALAEGKSGARTIVPGQPDASELMKRVLSTDPDEVMPKPDHGPRLKDKEIATLRQWITEGAAWSEHWSLVPPAEPAVPVLQDKSWPLQPLDVFVRAKQEAAQVSPAPPAGAAEWLRRVTLDLTGLPPSPEDYTAFQAARGTDASSARDAVVDRLLASPAFGEHWAAMWLDLARYADTYGFEKDPHRNIWPWRDWVIRALNADTPFDKFTISQLAGDQLENPTADDLLATAFHRNTQNNTEGGTSDEEFRAAAVVDRVNTTWTAWQATTFGCVQCHSHPYDPYPHEDYYRFMAFFDSTEDADLDDDFPRLPVANDPAARDAVAADWRAAKAARQALNAAGVAAADQEKNWQPVVPSEAKTSGGTLTVSPEGRLTAGGTLPVGVHYTLGAPAVKGLTALRLRIFPDSENPKDWPERAAVLSHFQITMKDSAGKSSEIAIAEVIADYLAGPFDPQDTLHGKPGGFGSYPALNGPRWCVFVLKTPLAASPGSTLEVSLRQNAVSNANQQACTLRHFDFSASTSAHWTALISAPQRAAAWADYQKLQQKAAASPATAVPVLAERQTPRDTRVWTRGNRLTKDASVQPGVPEKLSPPKPAADRMNRLEMARWLMSDRNPLTARVMANRLWAGMFGHGMVATLEDFGSSGATPSNQPLLDHLALRLSRHHAWSLKKLLREIALSATYAQTSRSTAEAASRDPQNSLLARGPRQRLSAEMVRDHALRISGLLSAKMGGAPVYPPQPDGVWNSVYSGQRWQTSEGEDRFRRAIYTYVKRTSGYPGFLTFDAPSRDLCTARRIPTNTPLQALVTLNDAAHLEIAAALARRMAAAGETPEKQIAAGCRLITLDEPPAALVAALTKLHSDTLADYRARPELSRKLAPTVEEAALTLVANTLLNTDLALNR